MNEIRQNIEVCKKRMNMTEPTQDSVHPECFICDRLPLQVLPLQVRFQCTNTNCPVHYLEISVEIHGHPELLEGGSSQEILHYLRWKQGAVLLRNYYNFSGDINYSYLLTWCKELPRLSVEVLPDLLHQLVLQDRDVLRVGVGGGRAGGVRSAGMSEYV